jgi:molybdate transport system substrate-binding protein
MTACKATLCKATMAAVSAVSWAALVAAAYPATASAAEIKLIASNAVKTVVDELQPKFEAASEHKLVGTWGAAANLKGQIEKGEAFDVAILTTGIVDDLVKQGKLAAGSRAALARSGSGVAVRRGAPKPDISTVEAFKQALRNAKSIGYVEQGQTGIYLKALLVKLGLADELKPKVKLLATTAAASVERGEVEMGLTQISEILPHPGAELVGPFPPEIQVHIDFSAAVATGAKEAGPASALIKFLTTPAAMQVIKAKGLEPAG